MTNDVETRPESEDMDKLVVKDFSDEEDDDVSEDERRVASLI